MPLNPSITLKELAIDMTHMWATVAKCDHALTCPNHSVEQQQAAWHLLGRIEVMEARYRKTLATLMALELAGTNK